MRHVSDELIPFVEGKTVHDLGAGACVQALQLLQLGAKTVIAVEGESYVRDGIIAVGTTQLLPLPKSVEFVSSWFEDYHPLRIEVAYLGRPVNTTKGAGTVRLVKMAKVVIYVGCNNNGNCCGTPELFQHFLTREVLLHRPHPQETCIVYGAKLKAPRATLPEELAGLTQDTHGPWTYEELHAVRKTSSEDSEPDWTSDCDVCGQRPTLPLTGMCGPCTFGEASTAGGNW